MQSIMVPLDGSLLSTQALAFATALAKRDKATLHLVHVHVPLAYAYVGVAADIVPSRSWELDAEQRRQEHDYLVGHQQRIAEETGLSVDIKILDGPVVESLASHAAETSCDFIVMSTHGRGPFARMWLGSVTDGMIRHSTTPLLVIRPHEELRSLDKAAMFHNMLVPLDGSELAEQALDPALALATPGTTTLTLVRIVQPYIFFDPVTLADVPDYNHQETERRTQEANTYLRQVTKRIEARGVHTDIQVLVSEQPAAALLDLSEEGPFDLVALSTHGRGGFKRILLGSIADKLARGSHCPLLVVRPAEAESNESETTEQTSIAHN